MCEWITRCTFPSSSGARGMLTNTGDQQEHGSPVATTVPGTGRQRSELCYLKFSVNSRRMQNLNALFGVAYREIQRFSVPQLGYLGYQRTK